jgi:hypothetical protein
MAERKSFLLRLDPDTFEAVQHWANDDLRSVNGQIEFVLRRALADAGRLPKDLRLAGGRRQADDAQIEPRTGDVNR